MQNTAYTQTVYILSGREYGPIYIGTAANMDARLRQHRSGRASRDAFRIDRLVYTETYDCPFKAEARKDALRMASREWVDALIAARNPAWQDLTPAPSMSTSHGDIQAA